MAARRFERFYRYSRDGDIPKHHIPFNYLYDLPIGRGKKLLGNVGKNLDRLVGGWQVAGYGSTNSRWVALPNTQWGSFAPLKKYGPGADQRLPRRCLLRRLHVFQRLPSSDGHRRFHHGKMRRKRHCLRLWTALGLCALGGAHQSGGYRWRSEFQQPNNVNVPLKNGTQQLVSYDTGLNPYRNQWFPGPWLTNVSASVYKTVALTERVKLRINLDAFNVLNQPGLPAPTSEGIISPRTSAQGARVLQYTARITW